MKSNSGTGNEKQFRIRKGQHWNKISVTGIGGEIMKKKLIALISAAVLAAGVLTGCGGESNDKTINFS